MASFFLIDHSLRNTEGHHFDYVQSVSRAASKTGLKTFVGTHRDFDSNLLDDVAPVFRETTYQSSSYLAGLRHLKRQKFNFANPLESNGGVLKRFTFYRSFKQHKRKRAQFIRQFAKDCERFFEAHKIRSGDHAFFTTVSELELTGLATFLSRNPQTLKANWHLQFHFNLYEGRTPEYERQIATTRQLRNCFALAKAVAPYHRVHFYTTSRILADQYNLLNVGQFQVLPYPIADCFRPASEERKQAYRSPDVVETRSRDTAPVRFTCPGGIRREKGHARYLQGLVNKIYQPHLRSGKAQLVLQRPPPKKLFGEKIELKMPTQTATDSAEPLSPTGASLVEYHRHPLSSDDYERLIKSTDCGLLFYDSRHYFSRRAGVLGELLSCGRPVIVPAGSWLSEQIKEINFDYADSLTQSNLAKRTIPLAELAWDKSNVPLPGGIVSFNQSRTPFEASFEMKEDELAFVVSWKWHWPQDTGVYAQIELLKDTQNGLTITTQTVGNRTDGYASAVFRRPDNYEGNPIRLRFQNAFHDSMASIKDLQVTTIGGDASIPLGVVGIAAANETNLAGCIEEMIQHYIHYRKSAKDFAEVWHAQHEPKLTIAHLLSVEQLQLDAA